VTGNLTYDASQIRVEDLHRSAARRRAATAAARPPRIRRTGVADPFRPTAHAVDLLRARAAQLHRRPGFAVGTLARRGGRLS